MKYSMKFNLLYHFIDVEPSEKFPDLVSALPHNITTPSRPAPKRRHAFEDISQKESEKKSKNVFIYIYISCTCIFDKSHTEYVKQKLISNKQFNSILTHDFSR